MNRFFTEQALIEGSSITLSKEESFHLIKVLRADSGDQVQIFNGQGILAEGILEEANVKKCVVKILVIQKDSFISKIHIAFSISKPPAMEFILKRCTEIGVGGFQPLQTQHSLKMDSWNESRWNKILVEVCKQCQSLFVPQLHPPVDLKSWLEKRQGTLIFFDEADRETQQILPASESYSLLLGPEGGWSDAERELIKSHNAIIQGLGRNRLRTEMAALVGTVLIKDRIGEL